MGVSSNIAHKLLLLVKAGEDSIDFPIWYMQTQPNGRMIKPREKQRLNRTLLAFSTPKIRDLKQMPRLICNDPRGVEVAYCHTLA